MKTEIKNFAKMAAAAAVGVVVFVPLVQKLYSMIKPKAA